MLENVEEDEEKPPFPPLNVWTMPNARAPLESYKEMTLACRFGKSRAMPRPPFQSTNGSLQFLQTSGSPLALTVHGPCRRSSIICSQSSGVDVDINSPFPVTLRWRVQSVNRLLHAIAHASPSQVRHTPRSFSPKVSWGTLAVLSTP